MLCTVMLCLWVVAANRTALLYFDTAAYLERGETLLAIAGLAPEASTAANPAGDGAAADAVPRDAGVDGSRSPVYSLIVALFARTVGLEGLLVANAALAVAAVWLCARVALRVHEVELRPLSVTFAAVAVAAFGSLPFFVALVMPDIFTPVLLLMAALLTAYGGRMSWLELAMATVLGIAAVLVHLSHGAIAMLLVPVSFVMALLFARRRFWIAPLLLAVMVLSGFAEQAAFRTAVKTVKRTEVTVLPFLTARLIEDGVGYAYLERHCPDETIPTCPMWDALAQSDDPERLKATNIAFERTEELGSYRLLDADDQRSVAQAQYEFFFDVLLHDPFGVVFALMSNTLTQAGKNSVNMTLQTEKVINRNAGVDGFVVLEVKQGPMAEDRTWIGPVTRAHQVLYGIAALGLFVGALWPTAPLALRGFLLMVLVGVLVNAFVCGGVSQPASRYGARVIWILPAMAVIGLTVLLALPQRFDQTETS